MNTSHSISTRDDEGGDVARVGVGRVISGWAASIVALCQAGAGRAPLCPNL